MIRLATTLAACLLVAGCASPPTPQEVAQAQSAPRPSNAEATARRVIGAQLKDPDSARYEFGALHQAYMIDGSHRLFGWFLCGQVIAKNSFGGYGDWDSFYVAFQGDRVAAAEVHPSMRDSVRGACYGR